MPIKVHIKGKRKAPPPPTTIKTNLVCENGQIETNASDKDEQRPNGIAINNNSSVNEFHLNETIQKRKKQAPPPPPRQLSLSPTKLLSNVNEPKNSIKEINNLSAPKRTNEKLFDKKINFNIFEQPTQIRNNFESSSSNAHDFVARNPRIGSGNANNLVTDKTNDFVDNGFHVKNMEQHVWICGNCTLRNPFWKIVCEACEKIKPYNTPNIPIANTFRDFDDELRINEKNLMGTVKMRPKTNKMDNNDLDKFYKRTSMRADMQQLARNNNNISNNSTCNNKGNEMATNENKMYNKRNSSYVAATTAMATDEQKQPIATLEMEKERIRAVIRAMNNRALAQKYPINATKATNNKQKINKYESIKGINGNRSKAMHENPSKANKIYKTEMVIDYSFPPKKNVEPTDYYLQTDDSKANMEALNIDKTIDKRNVTDEYYEFIGDLNNYCDQQTALDNTIKKLESNIFDKKFRCGNSLKFDNTNNVR